MLTYWFYPLPGNAHYGNPKVVLLMVICFLLIVASFIISSRRKHSGDSIFRRLSRSWVGTLRVFAAIGFALIIARVEDIQFLSMRFLWLLWLFAFFAYVAFQMWLFRKKHYVIAPRTQSIDPRDAYLPKPGSGK